MCTVLVIDDDLQIRQRLEQLLTHEVHFSMIASVGDGASALEVIDKSRPDIIFLDIVLPDMSGTEIADYIWNSPDYSPIIYAFSDMVGSAAIKRLLAGNGVSMCSPKSISDLSILKTLYSILDYKYLYPSYLSYEEYIMECVSELLYEAGTPLYYIYTRDMVELVYSYYFSRDFKEACRRAMKKLGINVNALRSSLRKYQNAFAKADSALFRQYKDTNQKRTVNSRWSILHIDCPK